MSKWLVAMSMLIERNSPSADAELLEPGAVFRIGGMLGGRLGVRERVGAGGLHGLEGFLRVGQVVREDDVAALDLATQVGSLGEQDFLDDGVLILARCVGTSDRAVAPLRIQDHPCHQQDADGGRCDQLGVKIREYRGTCEDAHPVEPPNRAPGHL